MQKMTNTKWRDFLHADTRTGKLATVRRDGRPHVVPIWFDLDGEEIVFTTGRESVKAKNIRRDPRVCICVDDQTPPFAFVQIEGTATLSDDLDELLYWTTHIGVDIWRPNYLKPMIDAMLFWANSLRALRQPGLLLRKMLPVGSN
jgi:PPOX class probable F420-dependent enzyme